MEPKRLLKNVQVLFISLVDKGANRRTVIWKSSASREPLFQREIPIKKVDEEKRLVYGIVYAPDEADTQGDMMTAEEIEKMAYGFMANRRTDQVDRQHDYNPDEGFVAESWLVRKNDPLFSDEPEGSWAVGIKVVQEETWAAVKSGEVGGLSMGGFANAEEVGKNNPLNPPLEGGKNNPLNLPLKGGKSEGAWDFIKEQFKKMFRGGEMEKDFQNRFQANTIREASWALNDALSEIMNDEAISDKKAAITESVNQFLSFINNMGDTPMANVNKDEKETPEVKDTPEVNKEQQPEQSAEIGKKLDELLNKVTALEERLAKVEKAHPGRQSAEGRDEKSNGQKGFKGLQIV